VWEQWVQTAPPLLSRAAVYCVHTLTAYEPYASLADACMAVSFMNETAPPLLSRAAVSCVHTLTAYEPYAALADACVRAYLSSPAVYCVHTLTAYEPYAALADACRDGSPLCFRVRLHAAYVTLAAHDHAPSAIRAALLALLAAEVDFLIEYVTLAAHDHAPSAIRAALLALLAAEVDFIEHEVIVAVWICATCRLVRELSFEAAEGEARAAAHALLTRCAEPPRRSLLQLVSLQAFKGSSTQSHRLLSLFALCVLSPTATGEARAFEAACGTVQGLGPDVANWGRAPHPKRLPRLAMRLYPNHEKYFREELDMVPEENTRR
ncbi:uncharacterized protein LOC114357947, partial [Ostrinia furnacalis]|uniref:uncharacterized protein LOC114357947 n=1 Tax=Ostrinia furnacalis TaxID=93504 RepID=UPI00103EECD1